ncbi:MAG: hypothetical protein LBP30_08310, partial [Clostridiales Family XIII bacterium]|nr:hypothetical protein [Clostridiales Family XIII bacterium]
MRESGVPRIRPAISFKSFGARVRNVQTRENENREYENFALNNGSRFMKDYLPALSDGRETWQPLWESEV